MFAEVGESAIEVTVTAAAVTVRVAFAVKPFAAAVMVAVPTERPVASPAEVTVAMAVFDEVQVTPEVNGPVAPLLKVALAMNCWDAPDSTLADAGESETPVTVGAFAADGDPQPAIDIKAIGRAIEIRMMWQRREFMLALRRSRISFAIDGLNPPPKIVGNEC
jgi:hypothetical protein